MANPMALPLGTFGLSRQQPQEPFVWGEGGQRMTPDEIAMQRRIADSMIAEGSDYSPVGHWTQGLARASQGILGGLRARDAERAADSNADADAEIMQAIMSGEPDAVAQALMNPYTSDQTRELAMMQWDRAHPEPVEPNAWERMLLGAGLEPGTPEWLEANAAAISAKNDPQVTVMLPGGGIFVGPQSELDSISQGGGGQASGIVPGDEPPAILPPDFDFGDERGPASAPGGFPGN